MLGIVISSILCLVYFEQKKAIPVLQYPIETKKDLTSKELIANYILTQLKKKYTDNSPNNQNQINFSRPYFAYRDEMRNTELYSIIRRMPKGAALHVHSLLMLDPEELLKLTYRDHLYICLTDEDLVFRFSITSPKMHCPVQWAPASKLRHAYYYNSTSFDKMLKDLFSVQLKNLQARLNAKTITQKKVDKSSKTISSLIDYRPVRERLIYESFENFYDDNIMYVEIRMELCNLYELNGTIHDKLYSATLHKQVEKKFMKTHPGFAGVKLIITAYKSANLQQVRKELNLARKMKQNLPDLVAGFDFVMDIDKNQTLTKYIQTLLEARNETYFFFHPGEGNWFDTPIELDLVDDFLQETMRIAHGNALTNLEIIRAIHEYNIAIEVDVLSNSVVSMVKDRDHPLATYLSIGLPVVLSSDDPGVWGSKPLSDEFFVAFVAIASKHADMRLLKKLAMDSISYSALDIKRKGILFEIFKIKWVEFINVIIDYEISKFGQQNKV